MVDRVVVPGQVFDHGANQQDSEKSAAGSGPIRNHRETAVLSVIDVHLWDRACWRGVISGRLDPGMPPVLAFMFQNEEAARAIFGRWHERFGSIDREDAIYISIIRDVSLAHPHHYSVLVASNWERSLPTRPGPTMVLCRFQRMHPETSANLDKFLANFGDMGVFLLMPAVLENGSPKILKELGILKRNIAVRSATALEEREIECMVLNPAHDHAPSSRPPGAAPETSAMG